MIYPRKINAFKKAKINLIKLTETYNRNKKTNAAQFNGYFEVYNEKCQKKRGGMLIIFLYLNMLQRASKISKLYYINVLVLLNFLYRYESLKF
jgi:hypothetical protein